MSIFTATIFPFIVSLVVLENVLDARRVVLA